MSKKKLSILSVILAGLMLLTPHAAAAAGTKALLNR